MDGTLECAFDQLIWPCIRVRLADADLGLCLVNGSAKCANSRALPIRETRQGYGRPVVISL